MLLYLVDVTHVIRRVSYRVVQDILDNESINIRMIPYTGVVQFCLRRELPVPGTKRGAILYLCGEY
jgi:hypothetical protein